jgi:hypothetical protein
MLVDPCREIDNCSAGKRDPLLLEHTKVAHAIHENLSMVPILSRLSPTPTLTYYT